MNYRINKAQWADKYKKHIFVNITDLDKLEDDKSRNLIYTTSMNNNAELGKLLWNDCVNNQVVEILDDEKTRIIRGEIPLPKGKTIVGTMIYDDRQQIDFVRKKIDSQLQYLMDVRTLAKAELDSKFAHNRKDVLKALLEIEKQPGYPYDIEWPDEL